MIFWRCTIFRLAKPAFFRYIVYSILSRLTDFDRVFNLECVNWNDGNSTSLGPTLGLEFSHSTEAHAGGLSLKRDLIKMSSAFEKAPRNGLNTENTNMVHCRQISALWYLVTDAEQNSRKIRKALHTGHCRSRSHPIGLYQFNMSNFRFKCLQK